MQEHTAGLVRNVFLGAGLLLSTALSILKLPDFVRLFAG
jgi:hypothetical protein